MEGNIDERLFKQLDTIEELDSHYRNTTLALEKQVEELENMLNHLRSPPEPQSTRTAHTPVSRSSRNSKMTPGNITSKKSPLKKSGRQ